MSKYNVVVNIEQAIAVAEKAMPPVGDDAYSQAVVSVFRRGFHDKPSGMSDDWMIMNQYLRLVEEVGEYQEAVMWQPSSDAARRELADVMIVLCQLSWLAGMEPAELSEAQDVQKRTFCFGIGHLARCLRKDTEEDLFMTQAAIKALAYQVHIRAKQLEMDVAEVMRAKCQGDEERGYRHEGKKDSRLTNWTSFDELQAKATIKNGDHDKVVNYGEVVKA